MALAARLVDVTVREARGVVSPTTSVKVTAPLPTLSASPWGPSTVEPKLTLLLLVVSVALAPSVTAPL